jgi:hypothetical protein
MRFHWLILALSILGGRVANAAPDARAAIQRALPFLERDGVAWMAGQTAVNKGSPCVSCHHVGFALWSHREAKRAGLPIPADRIDALERQAHAAFADGDEPRPMSSSQLILGRDGGKPAKIDLEQLARAQEKDGHFAASGQFPARAADSRGARHTCQGRSRRRSVVVIVAVIGPLIVDVTRER